MSVTEEKKEMRRRAKEARILWAEQAGSKAGEKLAGNFLKASALSGKTRPLAGYWPMTNEIDVRPLLEMLHQQGCDVALPVVVGGGKPLVFRRWVPGLTLEEGTFGTHHPDSGQPEIIPGLLLVPLLAFDEQGMRLGWGGGFYDRTLAALRACGPVLAVGTAYHGQKVDCVPHSSTDEALDWIVTDEETLEVH